MTKENTNNTSTYEGFVPKINDIAQKFLEELLKERERLAKDFPTCTIVIDDGRSSP